MIPNRIQGRRGLSMVEVVVSASVLSLLLLSVALVTNSSHGVFLASQQRDVLRQHAQSTLDRIADALATSSKSTFSPTPTAPFGSSTLDFQTPTGLAGSVITWGPKTRICLQAVAGGGGGHDYEDHGHATKLPNNSEIVLIRNPGVKGSVTTVLAKNVSDYLEGESANGKDDNGNGLIDENGLSFSLVGDQLTIRLTVADLDSDGHAVWVTTQTEVRLRN